MLDWTRLTPAVKRAAGIAKANFPAHHSADDVEQEIWVWIMQNKNTVTRILTEEDYEGTLNMYLVRAGQSALKTEDAQAYGYDEEDVFYFSLELIKSILEVVFEHEDWQSFATAAQDGMPRAKSEPATSGNNLASYADVSRAITALPEDQYNTLVWRYKYQFTFDQIGREAGITKQGAADRHRAALNAIQQFLGKRELGEFRYQSKAVARPANINSAQRLTERDYEG